MLFKILQWSPIGFEGELGSVVRPCPNHTIRSSQNPDSELVPQTQMTTMTILLHHDQTQMKTMAPTWHGKGYHMTKGLLDTSMIGLVQQLAKRGS